MFEKNTIKNILPSQLDERHIKTKKISVNTLFQKLREVD